jgi:hypothetical protein
MSAQYNQRLYDYYRCRAHNATDDAHKNHCLIKWYTVARLWDKAMTYSRFNSEWQDLLLDKVFAKEFNAWLNKHPEIRAAVIAQVRLTER